MDIKAINLAKNKEVGTARINIEGLKAKAKIIVPTIKKAVNNPRSPRSRVTSLIIKVMKSIN